MKKISSCPNLGKRVGIERDGQIIPIGCVTEETKNRVTIVMSSCGSIMVSSKKSCFPIKENFYYEKEEWNKKNTG